MPQSPNLTSIVTKFQHLTDPRQKYTQLLWYAKKLPPFPDSDRIPENQVPGCNSVVYITAQLVNNQVKFLADADSQIVKGLAGLLVVGLNDLSPTEIKAVSPNFIQDTGLEISLTPSRTNGFYNIFSLMQKKVELLTIDP